MLTLPKIYIVITSLSLVPSCAEFQLARKGQSQPPATFTDSSDAQTRNSTVNSVPASAKNNAAPGSTQNTLTIEELGEQCGFTDPSNKQTPVFAKEMKSDIVKEGEEVGIKYIAHITGNLKIAMTQLKAEFITSFDPVVIDAGLNEPPSLAVTSVLKNFVPFISKITFDTVPFDQRGPLFKDLPEWGNVYCTISLATKLSIDSGTYHTEVEFSPALPSFITPTATSDRYLSEIGGSRSFKNVEAKIVKTNHPDLSAGEVIAGGQFSFEGMNAERQISSGLAVKGDIAYRLRSSLGTPAQMAALGIKPVTEYYIDHTYKTLKGVVFDSGDPKVDGPSFFSER